MSENTVLLVEDDEATAELERRTLKRAGMSVHTATTAAEAVAFLARQHVHAVLLDYQLPDGDPWVVVEAARARSPKIPVILVTAMGNERVAAEAMHRGVSEYVKKTDSFLDRLPVLIDRAARLARTEEQLRETVTLFRLVADHASDMISRLDEGGVIKYVSPACRQILGLEPADLIGRRLGDFEEFRELERAVLADASHTTPPPPRPLRCRRRDGTYAWVETHTHAVCDPLTGVVTDIVSISRDITARKYAEDTLARERSQLAEAQQTAHVGSWDWDVQANRITWSDELCRIWGIQTDRVPSSYADYLQTIHPDDRDHTDSVVQAAYRDRASFEFQHRVVRPGGEVRLLKARGRTALDASGTVIRMSGTAQDITEQRLLEEALARRASELVRSNAELEQFAYVASHDLRAPLRSIASLARWLREDLADRITGESLEHFQLLQARVARLDCLLKDLLEFSRAGRIESAPEPVDVGQLLNDVKQTVHCPDGFRVEITTGTLVLNTCRLPLKRVLLNLVDNALKHHDRSAGLVRITAEEGPNAVAFTVADDGPGIPPRHGERIFQMFQTLKPRDEVEGSGMGLALVRKLVDSAGGSIALESKAERGSTFCLLWPKHWKAGASGEWPEASVKPPTRPAG